MKSIAVAGLLVLLFGCGTDNSQPGGQSYPDLGPTIACGQTSCDPASQYCYQAKDPNDKALYSTCFSLPHGCTGCDCAEPDAKSQENNDCAETIGCDQHYSQHNSQVNNQISVSCYPQEIAF